MIFMKKIFLHLLVALPFVNVFAQKEKFDIASFTPPKGWQRIDSNGIILFFDSKTVTGGTAFCQIFLYPSRQSNGKALSDFESEWANRVTKPTGFNEKA